MDFQSLSGRGRADQAHDDLVGFERHSLPVARDVAEEPVLDLVPLEWGQVSPINISRSLQLTSLAEMGSECKKCQ